MNARPSPGLRKDPRPQPAALSGRGRDHATPADVAAAALLALGAAFERHRGREHGHARAGLAAIPIVIVNYVAFRAQLRFWEAHLGRTDALLVSVALESVAIYWAWLAHQALIADDSALRPRLAAYGIALVIGVLNYSHYCKPGWKPTVAAVTFGGMSVISPWMWSAYSRRISRPILKARDLIEDHAVRLGITRWFWHAYRCVRVMHRATWTGENRPAEAIKMIDKPDRDEPGRARKAAGATEPPAAPRTPPPVTGPREPRGVNPPASREAPGTGLAAARTETEAAMIRELIGSGRPLPAARALAGDDRLPGSLATRRRAAGRILAGVAAAMNGNGGHE